MCEICKLQFAPGLRLPYFCPAQINPALGIGLEGLGTCRGCRGSSHDQNMTRHP